VNEMSPYPFLADLVLSLHVAIVVFIGGGLIFIILGNLRAWPGANALWFRAAHLTAISIVVAEAWVGAICPLTTFEMWLRTKAGATTYAGSFIGFWLQRILYYDAPPWAFALAYSLFGLVVAATWWYFPPRFRHRGSAGG
jgi:polyferredoxin